MRKLKTMTELQLLNCAYTHILGLLCKKLDQLEEHKKADLPTELIEYWLNKYRKQLDELHTAIVKMEQKGRKESEKYNNITKELEQ